MPLNVVVRFLVFLSFVNLIRRGTDISKYFRESLGLRNNESRLYLSEYTSYLELWQGSVYSGLRFIIIHNVIKAIKKLRRL